MENSELVFVYGTLRRGGLNSYMMASADFVAEGRVEGRLYRLPRDPGLVWGRGRGWVKGDVFRVGPELMQVLDEFEGHSASGTRGGEFHRKRVPVELGKYFREETAEAWVYEWGGPVGKAKRISSGDWLDIGKQARFRWGTLLIFLSGLCLFVQFLTGFYEPAAGGWPRVTEEQIRQAVLHGTTFSGIFGAAMAEYRREVIHWSGRLATRCYAVAMIVWWVLMT